MSNIREKRICQNCKKNFTIEPGDFSFYEKVKVPPPTFCPECRLQRRLTWRNERNLYKINCDKCGKAIISMYSKDNSFPVYCRECWWSDSWDPLEYGAEFNENRPLFTQFQELLNKIPRQNLMLAGMTKNCDYCNYFANGKDCYLCFGSIDVENCLYGAPYESKFCVDTFLARECEFCYECIDCEKLSHSIFSQDCSNSLDLIYCFDCKNCQDCIGCVGLRGQKYNIFNQSFSREEYLLKRSELLSQGKFGLAQIEEKFKKLKLTVPHRYSTILQSVDSSGDHIVQSKNSKHCFNVKKLKDSKYCMQLIDGQNMYDSNYCEFPELCYEYLGYWKVSEAKFSNTCGESNNISYSDTCSNCSNLFACIGLRNKSYCILNKQYSKEEYEKLVLKIIRQMNDLPYMNNEGKIYKYGEFFPIELSPFCYNETVAQEYFPSTKIEVLEHGYRWKDKTERNYQLDIKSVDIPNDIKDIKENIIGKVIECEHKGECSEQCTEAFKIIESEMQFYQRMNLPIPKLCPNCRHYNRLKQRNPLALWHRKCMCDKNNHDHQGKCPNEFETSYAPKRPEKVYCESCYNKEVY